MRIYDQRVALGNIKQADQRIQRMRIAKDRVGVQLEKEAVLIGALHEGLVQAIVRLLVR